MAKTIEEKKKVEKLKLKDLKKRHWAVIAAVGVTFGIMLGNIGGAEETPKADAKVETGVEQVTVEKTSAQDVDNAIAKASEITYTEEEAQKWLNVLIGTEDKIAVHKSLDYITKSLAIMNHYGEGTPQYDYAKAYHENMVQAYLEPNKIDGYADWAVIMFEAKQKF